MAARLAVAVSIVILFVITCYSRSVEARRLMSSANDQDQTSYVLRKGVVPPSAPSKGHNGASFATKMFQFGREHVVQNTKDSVPSPGMGH